MSLAAVLVASALCQSYLPPEEVGTLETDLVDEASGLAISTQYADRLYHVNDSGDGPQVYVSRADGSETTTFAIEGFAPVDVEDLAYGACPDVSGNCLFVADVGDNDRARTSVTIQIVRELETYPERVVPLRTLTLNFPDAPHDLEGVALHPNGDLYLLTKEINFAELKANPAHLFRISATSWRAAARDAVLVPESLGAIDLPFLTGAYDLFGQIVTSFDIAPDGRRFLALTYENAIEFNFDLAAGPIPSTHDMIRGTDYQLIPLRKLAQAEAVAYQHDGSGFLYDTEFHEGEPAPIMQSSCRDPARDAK